MNTKISLSNASNPVLTVLVVAIFQLAIFMAFDIPELPLWLWVMIGIANLSFVGVVIAHSIIMRRLKHLPEFPSDLMLSKTELRLTRLVNLSAALLGIVGGFTGHMWLLFPAILLIATAHNICHWSHVESSLPKGRDLD